MTKYTEDTKKELDKLQWFEKENSAKRTDTISKELERIIAEVTDWVETNIPDGRNKSIALTALEDAEMRARRGLYHD